MGSNAKKPSSRQPVRKKKKKRRLRKSIRYSLIVLCVLLCFFGVRAVLGLFSPSSSLSEGTSAVEETVYKTIQPVIYENTGKTVATVLIDPGHGGYDSGKPTDDDSIDIYEKDINLNIALKVKSEMERINPNIRVLLTRDSDDVPWPSEEVADLTYREEMQANVNADYFISLHCNADAYSSTSGYVFFIRSDDKISLAISQLMVENFEEIGWSSLHSINTTELLQVVTNSKISSILLEMAFMTNPEDMELLLDERMTDSLATAIASAYSDYIMDHPNLDTHKKEKKKEDTPAEPDQTENKETDSNEESPEEQKTEESSENQEGEPEPAQDTEQ